MKLIRKPVGLVLAIGAAAFGMNYTASIPTADGGESSKPKLPVSDIESIIGIQGDVTKGLLDLHVSRTDIGNVQGPRGVTFTPDFELDSDIYFQPLEKGKAFLNGDLALLEAEVNPFVAALVSNGLVFQAFHQHLPMQPQIWFVHFRGTGDPRALATAVRAALNTTGTPLPQSPPANPTTPLDAQKLATILHGNATVGDTGVVTVSIDRKDPVVIDGVAVDPGANISNSVEFQPLGGAMAAVVADFSMEAKEINPVVNLMLIQMNWYQGCLYNQETGEHPQLYFDHMLKTGDAYQLAQEIRNGLDLTDAKK